MKPLNTPEIHVYSRPGCHLCEELLEALVVVTRDRASIGVRNVDDQEGWRNEFGDRIPVVVIHGQVVCQHRLDAAAVLRALAGPAS